MSSLAYPTMWSRALAFPAGVTPVDTVLTAPPFKVGDIVKLKTGTSLQRVTGVQFRRQTAKPWKSCDGSCMWCVSAEYLNSGPYYDAAGRELWRDAWDYELVNQPEQQKKETTQMTKLYKTTIDGKDAFGTLLARDSNGNLVLEIKGTGQPVAVKPEDAEEVRPYTVAVRFFGGNGTLATTEYHFETDKGAVKKGDLVVLSGPASASGEPVLALVSRVDTKSDRATKRLNGVVLQTTKIVGTPAADDDGEGE